MSAGTLISLVLLTFGAVNLPHDNRLTYNNGKCPLVQPMTSTNESFLEDLRSWTVQYVTTADEILNSYICIQIRFEDKGREEVHMNIIATNERGEKAETWHHLKKTRTPSVYELDIGGNPPLEATVAFFVLKSKLAIWTCIQFPNNNNFVEGAVYLSKGFVMTTPQLMLMENILTKALPTNFKYISKKVRSDSCPRQPKKEEAPSMDELGDYYGD